MYLDYFGLRQKPFLITPDPAFLYLSQGHQQALAHLHYGLAREGGFVLLTGEVGTGKTTLCRLLIEELPDNFRLAYILNTKLDSAGVLAGICRELDIAVENHADVNGLVAAIYDNLLQAHGGNRHTLVIIEEAQNLSPDVLETLRLLTNLETSTTKLLHILLIGQPELLDTLAQPGLRQLNQRVVSRSHLGPLSRAELHHYIPHRIKMAGSSRPLFTPAAINLIYRKTGGIPRLVNLLAEHCLMGAYGQGRERVTAAIVRGGARELFATLRAPKTSYRRYNRIGLILLLLATAIGLYFSGIQLPGVVSGVAAPVSVAPTPDVVETAQIEESPAPVASPEPPLAELTAVEPRYPGVFQLLLQRWGLDEAAVSMEDTCVVAAARGLRCETAVVGDLEDLLAINRPLLVQLYNGSDGLDFFVVTAVAGDKLTMANSKGNQQLPVDAVLARQKGEALFLWRPPQGYEQPLTVGSKSPSLVSWLETVLANRGYLQETLVSGGVYTDYLAALVKAFQADHGLDVDGIVGVNTLLALDTEAMPTLLMESR